MFIIYIILYCMYIFDNLYSIAIINLHRNIDDNVSAINFYNFFCTRNVFTRVSLQNVIN